MSNVYDPFAIAITVSLQERLTAYDVAGHVPREIFRFCRYFLNYGGLLEGRVRYVRYRRSPIPRGGLEIPSTIVVFIKMKEIILEYYTEPENIKRLKAQSEIEEQQANDDLEEFRPADDVEASKQSDVEGEILKVVEYID